MAKQYTGIDGALYADGVKVARVSSWSFAATAVALETTTLADHAARFVYGPQSFSGSASIFYYETDAGAIEGGGLLGDVLRTTATPMQATHELELRLGGGSKVRSVRFDCLLNDVSLAASPGEVIQADVAFTVTGPLKSVTLV